MNRTAFRITLSILIVTIALLIFVDFITIQQTQKAFSDFLFQQESSGFTRVLSIPEIQRQLTLEQKFKDSLYNAIILVSILGIIFSIILGVLIASFITRPLRELKSAIQKLRESEYKFRMQPTGDDEVDLVIAEFNKLSNELEHQENLRRELISDISHEFKTPLTGLTFQIEGVKDGVLKLDADRFMILEAEIKRLTHLVESLQEYTRIRAKINNIKLEKVNVLEVVKQIEESSKDKLQKQKIKLVLDVPEKLFYRADKNMFGRIMDNLVNNAVNHSKGKNITITATKDMISVKDDGIGIAKTDLKYIFERFYRVDKSRSRDTGGLGLGLAIVKEMVEVHGWKIEARSKVGKGTEFIIKISD